MITLVLKNGKQIAVESGRSEDLYNFWMKEQQNRKPAKKGKK